jgi:phosphopantetheinyl transferase
VTANVQVFYYTGPYTSTELPLADALIGRIHPARKLRIERRASAKDRALDLAALRLLELGMHAIDADRFRLSDIDYPAVAGVSGKPKWIDGGVDFNISHSEGIVACVVSRDCDVGVDVEPRREIDPRTVRRLLAERTWFARDLTPQSALFRWTQIEAILKGAGVGVMHGREIEWQTDSIMLNGQQWWVQEIHCGTAHVAHVAFNRPATITVNAIGDV